MMATNWRQISFQTVAKIAPETKRYALATLQLQFSSVPAARSSEHAAVGSLPIALRSFASVGGEQLIQFSASQNASLEFTL
jgi:hypothetical protein